MSIFRKLIISEWVKSFLAAFIILILLISIANLINGLLRANVSTLDVLSNFIIDFPATLLRAIPISCLMASLFGLNRLINRNELTALFASGFSHINFLSTIAIVSSIVGLFMFVVGAYIQPFAKNYRDIFIDNSASKFKNLKRHGLRYSTLKTGKIWYKSKDYYFSFTAYDKANKVLVDVDLYFYDLDYKLRQKVTATRAEHMIDNSWVFHDGTSYLSLSDNNFPKSTKFDNFAVILNEIPADFDKIEADTSLLLFGSLWSYIVKLSKSGINTSRYEVQFWSKISDSLICILFALGASIAIFNPNRRSSSFGKTLVVVFVFVIFYWLINSYLVELGNNSKLAPFISCFTIPFFLILVQVYVLSRNRHIRN